MTVSGVSCKYEVMELVTVVKKDASLTAGQTDCRRGEDSLPGRAGMAGVCKHLGVLLKAKDAIHATRFGLECADGNAFQLELSVFRWVFAPLGNCARGEVKKLRQLE